MIDIKGIIKAFGLRPVLRGVDLHIGEGEFLTLFGPNGAGKTTLLRIVASLTKPTGGHVAVGGYVLPQQATEIRAQIGVVSHQPLLYGDLTARENLQFYAQMYGMSDESRIDERLKAVGLGKRGLDLVRTFSRGMLQRLSIARATLHDPPVLLLDEPYTGLDQDAAAILDSVLREVAIQGRTVMMTTHNIPRGIQLADRIAILTNGKIAYCEPADGLTALDFANTYAAVTGMVTTR
ncbi:MAG: heme ABC exporter ATP-binding protein CcmA [Chloroflexi bacterium]|nr:heme ABC exporter ATP-binding protein CcmA [Chloroflexota bacterium]